MTQRPALPWRAGRCTFLCEDGPSGPPGRDLRPAGAAWRWASLPGRADSPRKPTERWSACTARTVSSTTSSRSGWRPRPRPCRCSGPSPTAATGPTELALDFRGAGMHVARWVFSRDLLLDGETCARGEGDVQVWPRWQGREPRVFLAFTNGERSCVVSARAKDVRALCRRLVALVPRGEEQRYYDLDAELSTLLPR
ncbi:SsgA family sporulation/cell division regulator [Streptomyces sp. R33]|uniref:SsgA family sporulation/cell division regulator n=1 Tax=Streptomyces sp. R33 TaxID=3238629 RepID=A0AB39Y1G6_9ACTN